MSWVNRIDPVRGSIPIVPISRPRKTMGMVLKKEPLPSDPRRIKATRQDGKHLRGAELHREIGQRRRQEHEPDDTQRAPDPGAPGADEKGGPAPALEGHLISVDAGDDGSRLSRNVHEDRGGRTAVHGAVIDPGQHDDGAGRAEAERRRDEQGDPRQGADSGQHPHHRSPEATDEAEIEILKTQRGLKSVQKTVQDIHGKPPIDNGGNPLEGEESLRQRNNKNLCKEIPAPDADGDGKRGGNDDPIPGYPQKENKEVQ